MFVFSNFFVLIHVNVLSQNSKIKDVYISRHGVIDTLVSSESFDYGILYEYWPNGEVKSIGKYLPIRFVYIDTTILFNGALDKGFYTYLIDKKYEIAKDSLWRYFDKKGRLIKKEYFENGMFLYDSDFSLNRDPYEYQTPFDSTFQAYYEINDSIRMVRDYRYMGRYSKKYLKDKYVVKEIKYKIKEKNYEDLIYIKEKGEIRYFNGYKDGD